MASTSKGRPSRRKAQAPGKVRLQLKEAKVVSDEDSSEETAIENGIPKDLPEGTIVVQPEAVEDAAAKARKAPVRIDTSVLDNVVCTACGRQLNPYKNGAFQKHPELKVIICRRCEKFLNSGDISKDKDGSDEQCRWCGQGGRLSVCDECGKAFCKGCIMRNFNRSEFNKINDSEKWSCYLCDKAPLQGLRENYRNVRDTLKALQARDKAKAAAGNKETDINGTARSPKTGNSLIPQDKRETAISVQSSNSKFSGISSEDLNFDNTGLAGIINKLSVATNTFRDMLRALRSQFDGRGEDGDDDSPSMINFVLGSNLHEHEKELRCGKALSKGLETYLRSIKTILSAHRKGITEGPSNGHHCHHKTSASSSAISKGVINEPEDKSAKSILKRGRRDLAKPREEKQKKLAESNWIESDSEDVIILSDTDKDSPVKRTNLGSPTKLSSSKEVLIESPTWQSQKSKCDKGDDNKSTELSFLKEKTPEKETPSTNEVEIIASAQSHVNCDEETTNVDENIVAQDALLLEETVVANCDTQAKDDENIAAEYDLLDDENESSNCDNESINDDENVAAKNDLLDEEDESVNCVNETVSDEENMAAKNDLLGEEDESTNCENQTFNADENLSAKNDLLDEEDECTNCDNQTINDDENIAAKNDLLDEEDESKNCVNEIINDDENIAAKNDLLQDESDVSDSDADNDDENEAAKFDLLNELAEKTHDGDDENESADHHKKKDSQKEMAKKDKANDKDSDKNISYCNQGRKNRQSSRPIDNDSKTCKNNLDDVSSDERVSDDEGEKNSRQQKKSFKTKVQSGDLKRGIKRVKDKSSAENSSDEENMREVVEPQKNREQGADKKKFEGKKTNLSTSDSDSDSQEAMNQKSESKPKMALKAVAKISLESKDESAVPDCVISDDSSSDLLFSSGDDCDAPHPSTRKKKITKRKDPTSERKVEKSKGFKPSAKIDKGIEKKSQAKIESSSAKSRHEKLDKSSKEKQVQSKSEEKPIKEKPETSKPKLNGSKKEGRGEDKGEDEMDKEIEKLSRLPSLRKRKAKEMEEDEDEEDASKDKKDETGSKANKKLKPGPKSSKTGKGNADYDNLSSDGEKSASDQEVEEDEDDDLEPQVSFCLGPADEENNADGDENTPPEVTAEEDNDKEEDDEENSDINSSSEDEENAKNKSEKKLGGGSKKKASKAKDETDKESDLKDEKAEEVNSEDSEEEDIKKKKSTNNKLLDTKIPDSDDSDIGGPKKKQKKSSDDEASKGEESSSGSSLPSDSNSEDDDDSEEQSDEDEEGGKKKKKGKKKGGKKKKKRKGKKGSDKDEEEETDEDSKSKKGKGKKRKRIKKMADSSDEGEKDDDDDDDDDEKNKSGKRKQIRKVMSNKKLEDSTRAAAKAEEKRRKRIAAKQREFNVETITDENNPMNCPITTKLILEPGKEEGDPPVIEVNRKLIQKLKPHQVEAVQFMWDCMFESVKRSKKEEGAGCILAHCMGLGKTLSVVSFVHTILSHPKQLNQKTCLVVSPLNTVLNWQNEWGIWLDEEDQLDVWELASCKQNPARADMLKEWHASGGIMIIGYEMYRNLSQGARCKNKRQKKIFYDTLVNPGPDMVVCDEGHILKNEASSISKAMNQMKTRRRVVLTGTPLQNNLNEYHCMLSFVKPNLLGTRKEFNNRFISPIQNGQCTDSTQRDVKLMKARAHVLHEMLAGCVQRRDYSALTKFLPPKQEYVISVRLTDVQIDLYDKYLQLSGQGVDGVFTNKGARLFSDYQNLMKIWTHPWVLKLAEIRDEQKMKFDDEDSFIDDESEGERSFSSSDSSSEEEKMVLSDSGGEGTSLGPNTRKGTRRTRAKARRQAGEDSDPEEVIAEWKSKTRNGEDKSEEEKVPEGPKSVTKEWWAAYVTEEDQHKVELGNKLFLLFEILKMCEEIGDKVLIFSQSILSLNIIEGFLETVDSKFQQECEELKEGEVKDEKEEFGRSWTKNLDYYRMDGSTSAQNRQLWAANFNDIENHRTRLFLISTKAGGLGINLVAANRVIIFDASWNPSHDVQSIFRVYRFGQTKPCYIYRFLAQGTMEEKIYERQVTKLSLSQRVVDEHQIERHFSANDLKELYNFKPDRWGDGTDKPTLALPKDPLLAEILTNHKHCVLSFHEHDSMLENQIEQTLTEEEKKAAWEEYENEKKGIIIRGPGMERTASWPMMAAAQVLSREQITATVQALRQRLPDISEELFHLHVQQELRRQVQLKQEEMRRMEMLRMQEIQIMNMIKYQAQQSGLSFEEAQAQMAPWIQMQMQQMHRMRAAMQSQFMAAGMAGIHPSASTPMMANNAERISNNPEDAIELDEN